MNHCVFYSIDYQLFPAILWISKNFLKKKMDKKEQSKERKSSNVFLENENFFFEPPQCSWYSFTLKRIWIQAYNGKITIKNDFARARIKRKKRSQTLFVHVYVTASVRLANSIGSRWFYSSVSCNIYTILMNHAGAYVFFLFK